MAVNNPRLSPAQRGANFASATRQHMGAMGKQAVQENGRAVWEVPKARILQSIRIKVKGKITTPADVKESDLQPFQLFDLLRRIAIDYNDGFSPIVGSGSTIATIISQYPRGEKYLGYRSGSDLNSTTVTPLLNSCYGIGYGPGDLDARPADAGTFKANTSTPFFLYFDICLALNQSAPYGLILAQNNQTIINLDIDVNRVDAVLGTSGATLDEMTIEPSTVTFSIPEDPQFWPDFSMLKCINSVTQPVIAGHNYVRLETGMIYRKMILYFEDENGAPMGTEDITSNLELIFNTADRPYSIDPEQFKLMNTMQGCRLPKGYYALNLDYQGTDLGYAGSRDYIDSERITELAWAFDLAKSGKVKIMSEKISRLVVNR